MIADLRPPARSDHLCFAYDDPADFHRRARDLLVAGLTSNHQVWYVAPGAPGALLDRLRDVDGFHDAFRRGAARIVSLDEAYDYDEIVDPPVQVAAYAAATGAALAAGRSGLTVVADATNLVRTPAQLEAFTRYEHLIDRFMRANPMSALCAYDRRVLGDASIAELACMHPASNTDDVMFHLSACERSEGCAVLAGELDMSNHELFARALERADPRPVDGELRVPAAELRFIDHRCLFHLRDYARRRGATAVLRTSASSPARLVEMLGLSDIRVEVTR